MQWIESLILACLGLTTLTLFRPEWQSLTQGMTLVVLVLAMLSILVGSWRWPLLFYYVACGVIGVSLLRHSGIAPPWPIPALTIFTSFIAILLGTLLLLGLPLRSMPSPGGLYPVGVRDFVIEDPQRPETASGPAHPRQLYVKAWYPGDADDGYRRVGMWEELFTQDQFRTLRFVLGHVRHIPSNSYRHLPVAREQAPYPVLIYQHAIVSYPSENSLLMEYLASRGYIIFSISHVNQLADFKALQGHTNAEDAMEILRQVNGAPSEQDKAKIGLAWFEAATATNKLTDDRVLDSARLLATLQNNEAAPESAKELVENSDLTRLGMLGHSLGGAVSTAFCKRFTSCRAVVNLDGGLYGSQQRRPLTVPGLHIASTQSAPLNAYQWQSAQADYFDYVISGIKHGDLTDQAYLLPILKWVGVLGKTAALDVMSVRNRLVDAFFGHYLKGENRVSELETRIAGVTARSRSGTTEPVSVSAPKADR